jgi:hypothetical protein
MHAAGIDLMAFVFFLINLSLIIGWVIVTSLGLLRLRRLSLSEWQSLLWTAIVLFVPFVGSVAVFWRTSVSSRIS